MLTFNPQDAWFLAATLLRFFSSHSASAASGGLRAITTRAPWTSSRACSAVAPIRKEDRAAGFEDYQDCRCSRKPAKIANIGKMRNQQGVEGIAVEASLQSLQTAFVVHAWKFNKRKPIADSADWVRR